jgi:glycerol-3-phosphate dehydrogenase
VPGHPPIAAEAAYFARFEMATHLSDLLSRRTRLALTDPAAGIGAGSRAVDLLGEALGWSRRRRRDETVAHRLAVERERGLPLGTSVVAADRDSTRVG